ncbi:hypothetical protein PLANTIT3_20199 [Plantibacter sp. T3]|nr:hypothetical protein PLANTIT3_20199 [Plantibacter sp. T3]
MARRERLPLRVPPAVPGRQGRRHRLLVRAMALPLHRRAARDRDARHGRDDARGVLRAPGGSRVSELALRQVQGPGRSGLREERSLSLSKCALRQALGPGVDSGTARRQAQ